MNNSLVGHFSKLRNRKLLVKIVLAPAEKKLNLKEVEAEILFYLSKEKKANAKDIFEALNLTKGHISQAVAVLTEKGYILQSVNEKDKRFVNYEITELGNEIEKIVDESWKNLYGRLLKGISKEDFAFYKKINEQIENNITELIKQEL